MKSRKSRDYAAHMLSFGVEFWRGHDRTNRIHPLCCVATSYVGPHSALSPRRISLVIILLLAMGDLEDPRIRRCSGTSRHSRKRRWPSNRPECKETSPRGMSDTTPCADALTCHSQPTGLPRKRHGEHSMQKLPLDESVGAAGLVVLDVLWGPFLGVLMIGIYIFKGPRFDMT